MAEYILYIYCKSGFMFHIAAQVPFGPSSRTIAEAMAMGVMEALGEDAKKYYVKCMSDYGRQRQPLNPDAYQQKRIVG